MSQIEELQGRIAAALDRIGQGVDRLVQGEAPDADELAALRQELADERIANEQLKARVTALRERREALETELEDARQTSSESIRKVDADLQGLRAANEKLREINAKLREANEAGVAEPHLINNAMMAELEGLRATRAADRAETEAICSELAEAVSNTASAEQPEGQ